MKLLPIPLLLCSLETLAFAKPLWPMTRPGSNADQSYDVQKDAQQLLLSAPDARIPPPRPVMQAHSRGYRYEAQENSVGVLLTDHGGEYRHFWLPIGKRIQTRDAPDLPRHPVTARITTMINTSPRLAAPERLDRIQCEVWTYSSKDLHRGKKIEQRSFSFSKVDGLVRFADDQSLYWLGNQEVESYVCAWSRLTRT